MRPLRSAKTTKLGASAEGGTAGLSGQQLANEQCISQWHLGEVARGPIRSAMRNLAEVLGQREVGATDPERSFHNPCPRQAVLLGQ